MLSSLWLVRLKYREIGRLSCVYWIKPASRYMSLSYYEHKQKYPPTEETYCFLLQLEANRPFGIYCLWKLSSDNEASWLPSALTKNRPVHTMYFVSCQAQRIESEGTKPLHLTCFWTPAYLTICVCVCVHGQLTPLCVCLPNWGLSGCSR